MSLRGMNDTSENDHGEPATLKVTTIDDEVVRTTAPILQPSSLMDRSSQWFRSFWYGLSYRKLREDEEMQTLSRKLPMYTMARPGDFVIDNDDADSPQSQQSDETLHSSDFKKLFDENEKNGLTRRLSIHKSALTLDLPPPQPSPEPWYKRSIGLIYMIAANVMFSAMGLAIKALSKSSERIPVLELVAIRGGIGFLLCLVLMWKDNVKHWFGPPGTHYLLYVRGIMGFTSLTFNLYALNALSLGDATVLGFLAPSFTGLLGKIILKESWEVVDALAGGFSLVGVMFIARPSFLFGPQKVSTADPSLLPSDMLIPGSIEYETQVLIGGNQTITTNANAGETLPVTNGLNDEMYHLSGILAGILGAIFVAAALISIRKLSGKVHFLHILSYFHWMAVPCSLLVAPLLPSWIEPLPWIWPTQALTWILIATIITTGFLGQMLLSWALQKEKAAKAASMNYAQIVFAFLGEWVCWGLIPSGMSLFGSLIVISCMVTVTLYKLRKTA